VKNIPLNYFSIIFSEDNKAININTIVPAFTLIEKIKKKKSKNFSSIIYQSEYYNKADNVEKRNILKIAIIEK